MRVPHVFVMSSLLVAAAHGACIEPTRFQADTAPDVVVPPADVAPDIDDTADDVSPDDVVGVDVDPVDVGPVDVDPVDVDPVDAEPIDAQPVDVEPLDTAPLDVGERLPCLPEGCAAPDGSACRLEEGWCWIDGACVDDEDHNPENDCQVCDSDASPRAWATLGEGSACDDGASCTKNDACVQGVCMGDVNCPQVLSCIQKRCDVETDQCVESVQTGFCHLNNTCFSAGVFSSDGCASCRPGISATAWTPGDTHEPDDAPENATQLAYSGRPGNPTSFSGWDGPFTTKRLWPVTDVDAFRWEQPQDEYNLQPAVWLDWKDDRIVPVKVCIFTRCVQPVDAVDTVTTFRACGGGQVPVTRDGGWVGCCIENSTSETPFFRFSGVSCSVNNVPTLTARENFVTVQRILPVEDGICEPYNFYWGRL